MTGTTDVARIEAPVTAKAYMMCAFASFGGILFGYDSGYISGVMGMDYFINLYVRHDFDCPIMSQTLANLLPFRLASQFPVLMLQKPNWLLSFFPPLINL